MYNNAQNFKILLEMGVFVSQIVIMQLLESVLHVLPIQDLTSQELNAFVTMGLSMMGTDIVLKRR